jgi:hypothetical protein
MKLLFLFYVIGNFTISYFIKNKPKVIEEIEFNIPNQPGKFNLI